ncbi:MAG: hypothetical protein IT576_20705 [Verrucomicrobiales bacterium]|nr:hypothetical protein [Verrucomicrobiales bacterium]
MPHYLLFVEMIGDRLRGTFPDVPGCEVTATTLAGLRQMAKSALRDTLDGADELTFARTIQQISRDPATRLEQPLGMISVSYNPQEIKADL